VTDVPFELVRAPRQFSFVRLLWFYGFVWGYCVMAAAAVARGDRWMAIAAVICAALVSPVLRFLGSVTQKVSAEEADLLRSRLRHPERSAQQRRSLRQP